MSPNSFSDYRASSDDCVAQPLSRLRFFEAVAVASHKQKIESLHESAYQPPSNAGHLEGLGWLIGDWIGEDQKGESGKASYSWTPNGNFIICDFDTTLNGATAVGGTQYIGWDAADKQVRSWTFYSKGGFAEAVWTPGENTWTSQVTARTAAGQKVTGTIVYTKVDADHITSQITKLTVDGKSIPDTQPLKFKRVKG